MLHLTHKKSINYAFFSIIQVGVIASGYISGQVHVIAIWLILASLFNILLARKNIVVFLLYMMYGYFNYSIVFGEYLGWLGSGMPDSFYKPEYLYLKMLALTALFNVGFSYFAFNYNGENESGYALHRNNSVISFFCFILAVGILFFGLDRSHSYGYEVRISEVYEYSVLVFLVGLAFSTKRSVLWYALIALALVFVIEDIKYGGRITSVRILLVLAIMCFYSFMNIKRVVVLFLAGIFLMGVVGSLRHAGGFDYLGVKLVLIDLSRGLLVFDTVVYAYYASITHLMLREIVGFEFVVQSITSLLAYLPVFGVEVDDAFNLTKAAASRGFINVGGGVAPSFFYFWFGYVGVFLAGFSIAWVYKFFQARGGFGMVCYVALIASFPRWFLYGPWVLPRTALLMLLAYVLYRILFFLASKPKAERVKF